MYVTYQFFSMLEKVVLISLLSRYMHNRDIIKLTIVSDSDIVIRLQGKRFFNRKKVRVELENGPALAQGACSAQFHVIRRLLESAN